jgi:3-methyladenine DNA glycosylase/8-oxoguanine DNA glycosylase
VVTEHGYRRCLETPAGPALIEVTISGPPGSHVVRARSSSTISPRHRTALVARLLDLDTELAPFRRLVRTDAVLGPAVARRPGIRRPLILDPFEGIVRAIVGQQVSVRAACTVIGRIVARFGRPGPNGAGLVAFPSAERLAAAGPARIAGVGLTGARARSIAALAAMTVAGELDWARLARLSGDDAQRALEAMPGIGPWTAAYLRLRVIGDPDAFPATDLGVIRALERRGIPRSKILARAEAWRPWRGYAAVHLWASE